MKPFHLLLAVGIVVIWGFNFVVIKIGLKEIPPLFLCVLRFTLAAFPAVFFIPRPAVPSMMIVYYGLLIFVFQFAFLFSGMYLGMSAGLSSLALQIHVFVTIALALIFLNEKASILQIAGAFIAFIGIGLIAINVDGKDASVYGLVFVLLAAVFWGAGNILSKKIGKVDMLALVVWGSLVAPLPLLCLSLLVEGSDRIVDSLIHMNWLSIASIAYLVYPSTLLGYAIWSWLMSNYPAASVAPLTLLVPIFGMTFSAITLGEPLQTWKIIAAVFVMFGLCLNIFGTSLQIKIAERIK